MSREELVQKDPIELITQFYTKTIQAINIELAFQDMKDLPKLLNPLFSI